MNLRLSIKPNLLVNVSLDKDLRMKKAEIQSYTTIVGLIEDGKIFVNGKFSRTTTKHMSHIFSITGLSRVESKEKKYFWWLPDGTRITHDDSVSDKMSSQILSSLSKGESLCYSVAKAERMGRKDSKMLNEIIEESGLKELTESLKRVLKSFHMNGVIQ